MIVEDNKLSATVNQSGFPLQIGIATIVGNTTSKHGWKVLRQEHSWRNEADDGTGFIDIVLENQSGTAVLVLECKRVLNSAWIFLNPATSVNNRRHAKGWLTRYVNGACTHFDWHHLSLSPASPETEFCVVPGQDAKSKPMLERIASDLVSATEAYAREEKPFQAAVGDALRMYFSVIVTTSSLKVCSFDPNQISLSDGKIDQSQFVEVPYVSETAFNAPAEDKSPCSF